MLSKLRSYWDYGNTFCGIEITSISGEEKIYGITAKKKDGEFTDLEFMEFPSLSQINKKLPKNQHSYLVINSDKVLIKSLPFQENEQKTISEAFPGLSLLDFYYEILKTPFGCTAAVCRKDYVQNILKDLEQQKLDVLGFHLGINALQVLAPILREESIHTPRYTITTLDNGIKEVAVTEDYSPVQYDVEGIKVPSEHLLPLSGLFNYISKDGGLLSNFVNKNKRLHDLHGEKIFFRKGVVLAIGLLLIALLINTFYFNSYFKREQQLDEQLTLVESQQKGLEGKQKGLIEKEQIVDHILSSGSSKSSYYLNRIATLKPSTIGFTDIQYQPLNRSIRPNKKIDYTQNVITITGESRDKSDFSQWILDLGKLEWAEKVTVNAYEDSNSNESKFTILLKLKNDAKE
jgi:Tfp pilus assembly protein PilN